MWVLMTVQKAIKSFGSHSLTPLYKSGLVRQTLNLKQEDTWLIKDPQNSTM